MKHVLILIFCLSLLFSCAIRKSSFQLIGEQYPPYTGEVKILDEIPEEYTDIGWIYIEDNKTWIDMYSEAKEKARQHGANAIIYSQHNNKIKRGGIRAIVCRAIYVKE